MYDNLARRAILAALSCDWPTALSVNLTILSEDPTDTDALNRGARAYFQLGDITKAIDFSKKVLSIDPLNTIANKCLDRCKDYEPSEFPTSKNPKSLEFFFEIPGRTKIVSLVNLCDSAILAHLDAGDNVQMLPKTHKVAIVTPEEIYIGRLPDDLAVKVIYFIKNGNEYETYIKSVSSSEVKVFIKETKRSNNLFNVPSFPLRFG